MRARSPPEERTRVKTATACCTSAKTVSVLSQSAGILLRVTLATLIAGVKNDKQRFYHPLIPPTLPILPIPSVQEGLQEGSARLNPNP
jgi:hypothetical protein